DPGQLVARFDGDVAADLAGLHQRSVLHRQLARRVNPVAAAHRGDVGAQWLHDDRQVNSEFGEPGRRAHFGRFRYATCCSPVGPGSTETSSHPSAPHWSRICLVAWVNSGTGAYSHVVGWLISRAYR